MALVAEDLAKEMSERIIEEKGGSMTAAEKKIIEDGWLMVAEVLVKYMTDNTEVTVDDGGSPLYGTIK